MQIHLVLGHNAPTASGAPPTALYCGICADAAVKTIADTLATGQFPVVEQCHVPRGLMRYADAEAVEAFSKRPPLRGAFEEALDANGAFAEEVTRLHEVIAQLETDLLGVKFGRENMSRLCTEANKEAEKWQAEFNRIRGEMVQTGNESDATIRELRAELTRITEERNHLVESSEVVIGELKREIAALKVPVTTAAQDDALSAVTTDAPKPAAKSGSKGQKPT